MKLLRVEAKHFKNTEDGLTIDFVAKTRLTNEDKEYELMEVAENLFVSNVAAIIGKNASGKTTIIELLDCCYSILGDFYLENKHYSYENIQLTMYFFYDGSIYKYDTTLQNDPNFGNKAIFEHQSLKRKSYFKSKAKEIYCEDNFEEVNAPGELPEDTSMLFFVLKKKETRAVYFDCVGKGVDTYQFLFKTLKKYEISSEILLVILRLFDETITALEMVDDHNYKLTDRSGQRVLSDKELIHLLSSGTTKGLLLYTMMVASLQHGFTLLIDEVENHFHKTLVENMLALYKDKRVNRKQASLVLTTHYCELLDMFGRQDNIWICQSHEKIQLLRMATDFTVRNELVKSKQFYQDTFRTAVDYESLMLLKKELLP